MIGRRDRSLIPLRGLTLIDGEQVNPCDRDPAGDTRAFDTSHIADVEMRLATALAALSEDHVRRSVEPYGWQVDDAEAPSYLPAPMRRRLEDEGFRLWRERVAAPHESNEAIDRWRLIAARMTGES